MAVPWANLLADVATKHPLVHMGPNRFRNGPTQFYGEIADALAAIHHVRLDNGTSGTGIQASRARAAMVSDRTIGLKVKVQHHLRQKEVTPFVLVEEQAVLSNPTQPRPLSPSPFHDGRRTANRMSNF